MAKKLESKTSPFDALRIARLSTVVEKPAADAEADSSKQPDIQTGKHLEANPERALAKSIDPQYTKFTTYIRKETHLGVKTLLVSQRREMSDLVEELLKEWLRKPE